MRIILLLLTLFSVLPFVNGQESFVSKITLDDATQAKYLLKVIPLDDYCIFLEESEDTIASYLEIHLEYDQNFQFYTTRDNDTLFIFDGKLCGGYETGVVNVCQFINGEPKTLVSRPGKIAGIIDDEVWVYNYPCCAQVLNIIVPFSLGTGKKVGNAHVFYSREDYATIFPFEEKEKQKYQFVKDTEVHWSPFESQEAHVPVCGSIKFTILNAPKETEFRLIEVAANDRALIRIDDVPISDGYCIGEYHQDLIDDEKFVLYGWVRVENIKWNKN